MHTNNISLLLKSNKTREYINPEIWFICSRFVKTAYIDLFAPLYRVVRSKLYIYRWWLSLARIGAHVTSTSMSSKWLCKNTFLVSLETRLLVDLKMWHELRYRYVFTNRFCTCKLEASWTFPNNDRNVSFQYN